MRTRTTVAALTMAALVACGGAQTTSRTTPTPDPNADDAGPMGAMVPNDAAPASSAPSLSEDGVPVGTPDAPPSKPSSSNDLAPSNHSSPASAADATSVPVTPHDKFFAMIRPKLRDCYMKALQKQPDVQSGKVTVTADPSKNGCKLVNVKVSPIDGSTPPELVACFRKVLTSSTRSFDFCAKPDSSTITEPIRLDI